jgi:outer membrane protein assembly factor BamB
VPRATTSCSAIAFFVVTVMATAAPSAPSSPLGLFPVYQAWNQPLDKAVTAPPAFAGHRAFFPVEGGAIAAIDVDSGKPEWTAPADPSSTPASGEGLLFVAEPTAILALDQETGETAWRVPFETELAVPLVWDNGWLIGADVDGTLLAFRAKDGTLIWKKAFGTRVHAPPALAADRVYAALEDNRVVAMEVSTGSAVWERKLGGAPNEMLALDDRVYVGSDDNFLYCLLASDGEIGWRWRTGGDVIGVPVVDDRRVYFVSRDNVLRALDRRSGSQRWKRALPGRPTRGPVRAGAVLLVSGVAPKVSAFAIGDGAPVTEITASGELAAAPFVSDVAGVPQVVIVARDLAKGTRVIGFRRTIDPRMDTPLPTLPGAIQIAVPKKADEDEKTEPTTSTPDRP